MDDHDAMAAAYRSLFRDVSPYVVLVEQVGRIDYFCIGSVIQSEDDCTFILTQAEILQSHSKASLSVRFFDGHKQSAVAILCEKEFSILKTKFYPKCKELQFFAGEINFTNAAAVAPSSSTSAYNAKGFVMQRSLKAGGYQPGTIHPNSEQFFIFSCPYGATCPNGSSRLITGPVFNMGRQVLGFVIDDMRSKHFDKEGDFKNFIEKGFMLKTCITATEFERQLAGWLHDPNWRHALKALAKKPS